MPTVTKGSQTSSMPDDLPIITEQDESFDPGVEDPEIAEARDYNLAIAEVEAMAGALGTGGRGQVTVDTGVPDADIAELRLTIDGQLKIVAAVAGLALTPAAVNSIYYNVDEDAYQASITGFPTLSSGVRFVPLAIYDDNTQTLTDSRPQVPAGANLVRKVVTANGGRAELFSSTALLSNVSGASVASVGLIPAGSRLLGVTSYVVVALGIGNGTTGYQVGDGSDPDLWGAITGTAIGTDSDLTDQTADHAGVYPAAQDVVVTAVGGNFDGTGDIRLQVFYWQLTAPTS